jgi:hypothetical protein
LKDLHGHAAVLARLVVHLAGIAAAVLGDLHATHRDDVRAGIDVDPVAANVISW